jgi:fucose permease
MSRTLFPHFFAFLLTGGLLAYPGACLDLILRDFGWSPGVFGVAMLLQGVFSFVGSKFASQRSGGEHYRRWVVWSLLLLGAGLVLYYFADWTLLPLLDTLGFVTPYNGYLRMIGICCIGFGIGCNGILNNTAALVSGNPSFGLNLLNMGFTAGAVLLPLSTSLYLQIPGLTDGSFAWRVPSLVLVTAYVLLAAHCKRSEHLAQPKHIEHESDEEGRRKLPWPVFASSLVLFCYVGSEINISNSLGLMSELLFGFSNTDSRVASSIFWAGLLGARIYFCFRSPPAQLYPRVMTLLSLACVLLFASLLFKAFLAVPNALLMSRALILCLGVCIGGMYSLSLGALTALFNSAQARQFANTAVMSGVAGAVVLPFAFGQITDAINLSAATSFVFVLILLMFAGAALLLHFSRKISAVHSGTI